MPAVTNHLFEYLFVFNSIHHSNKRRVLFKKKQVVRTSEVSIQVDTSHTTKLQVITAQ